MDDQGCAAIGENVFEEAMEKYIPVHFLQGFTIIPWRWPNESVICPFVSPVKEEVSEPVL